MNRFMAHMLIVVTLCLTGYICTHVLAECQIADRDFFREQLRLHSVLFKNYVPKLSPVVVAFNSTVEDDSSSKYTVLLTLEYLKLTRMNEPGQEAEFTTEYTIEWKDERLKWDPKDYCGIHYIYAPSSDVWFPDITFVTAHSPADYRNDDHKFVRTQDFPFDRLICSITIKSALFSAYEYGIQFAFSPQLYKKFLFDRMGNEEWRAENLTAERYLRDRKFNDSFEIVRFPLTANLLSRHQNLTQDGV
ncbi:unnamed protein product [Cylicocyclus nassatus]|uniref:Neurotransmitter-gated ion-channel ligand-binding domain-containing protein n=1 Tax=Cylicocyclus nassatus TaxID=53992 RepID=A0AA36MC70_CYLNA|nr:unnamed protein product [Cylicocyclus nassatus]